MGRRKINPGEIRHAYNIRITDPKRLGEITFYFQELRKAGHGKTNEIILHDSLKARYEAVKK